MDNKYNDQVLKIIGKEMELDNNIDAGLKVIIIKKNPTRNQYMFRANLIDNIFLSKLNQPIFIFQHLFVK